MTTPLHLLVFALCPKSKTYSVEILSMSTRAAPYRGFEVNIGYNATFCTLFLDLDLQNVVKNELIDFVHSNG